MLILLCIIPLTPIQECRCDLVEVNHFFDEQGRPVFDQLIFWDWCENAERHQVVDWRLLKSRGQIPTRDWTSGGYLTRWQDGETLRAVRAIGYRETWTQYDPELSERDVLPKDERRGLR